MTIPIVGIKQPTLQSAELSQKQLTVSEELPQTFQGNPALAGGDGTVPEISAIPVEFSRQDALIASSIAERHGSLQNQRQILEDILKRLQRADFDLQGIRGEKAISLALDDVYLANEPVIVRARVIPDLPIGKLKAEITCVSQERSPLNFEFGDEEPGQWMQAAIDKLLPGLYRLKVQTENSGEAPNPVSDLFEVVENY